ncbi:Nudix family hydrolase [Cognatiluteimonas profundi]|uniref:Nudix family hydrolase n=1 Tax=Cognatiluteimonas profundi TaxID=2594501 RepID=UPI00131C5F3F|nr:Nudix family hydrolase [Lysobacter profundi]
MTATDAKPVDVVAGVLQDARGRILLARRTKGRDLAGLWEFPGGKREPGETSEAALARELHEELGIDVEVGAPLISVPQQYPHKRLRLDVRRIASWHGTPRGHEGQALAWAPPHMLASYAMPPADRPVVAALVQPDRYLVTPDPGRDTASWLSTLQVALDSGIRRIQLRPAPAHDRESFRALARIAVGRCRIAGVDVLLNADIELALELGAGVHLRDAQLRELSQRPLPEGLPVAASCHDVEGLSRAERLRCDFVVLGPVAATTTHPGVPGMGWNAFSALRESVSLPIYAIGGMTSDDIAIARTHGGQGIAAIRALWTQSL